MKYTTINEFKKYLEQSYYDPIEKDDPIEDGLVPENDNYTTLFVDYPDLAIVEDKDKKLYVYTYSNDEDIYNVYLQYDHDKEEYVKFRDSEIPSEITENYLNDVNLDLTEFTGEFDKEDALYLIDDEVLAELYEYYKGFPLFIQKLDAIFKKDNNLKHEKNVKFNYN